MRDPAYLRSEAERVRSLSELSVQPPAKKALLSVAKGYAILARHAEERRRKPNAPKPLTHADYEHRAKACRDLALHMPDATNRAMLREIAAEWESLALDP